MSRALLQAGLRHHQAGRLREAKALYEQILTKLPSDPDALHLAGVASLQLGDPQGAWGLLQQAVLGQPENPGFHSDFAQACLALGRAAEAETAFRRAAAIDPANPQFAMEAANCAAMQGRVAEAERELRGIVGRHPDFALAWFNLGIAQREQGRMQEAADSLRRTIALAPSFPDAWNTLGNVLHLAERFEDAERCFREYLARQPDDGVGHANLASVLIDRGRFADAETLCRQAVARCAASPNAPKIYLLLATTLAHQGKMNAMLVPAREAAALAPHEPRAAWAYGYALVQTGSEQKGLAEMERALALQPEPSRSRAAVASVYLARGEMQSGWRAYDARRAKALLAEKYPGLPVMEELPARLAGSRIGLVREQGLGDTLFFLRFAPELKSRGAHVICVSNDKIVTLLGRVSALDEVVLQDRALPPMDFALSVGSLPRALYPVDACAIALPTSSAPPVSPLGQVTGHKRLLRIFHPVLPRPLKLEPLPDRLDEIRKSLAALGSPPYFAVTWRAGTPPAEQRGTDWVLHKEVPLDRLAASLQGFQATLLAVQRHPAPGEIAQFALHAGRPVHDLSALNDDLESMLALLALVDEYIGVSNTNAHLRAGVAATARVLVPQPAEWRWMSAGDESPWFPGFRVYRQNRDGDWSAALTRLKIDLAEDAAQAGRIGCPDIG